MVCLNLWAGINSFTEGEDSTYQINNITSEGRQFPSSPQKFLSFFVSFLFSYTYARTRGGCHFGQFHKISLFLSFFLPLFLSFFLSFFLSLFLSLFSSFLFIFLSFFLSFFIFFLSFFLSFFLPNFTMMLDTQLSPYQHPNNIWVSSNESWVSSVGLILNVASCIHETWALYMRSRCSYLMLKCLFPT